jgi:hypothetical protein
MEHERCHNCDCWLEKGWPYRGNPDRPATAKDIADLQKQLAAVANDPNMTIGGPPCDCWCHEHNAHHIEAARNSLWDAETGKEFRT